MFTRRAMLAGLAALPATAATAQPATFPAKPLVLVVPFPPGGPADIFGRYLAAGMAESLGKPIAVENKSGAAGVAGLDVVAKAGLDAHVMGLASASAGAIMPNLMTNMPYDPGRDLAPVILVVRVQEVLVMNASLGIGDLKTLINQLKANPTKFSYGSAGTGGITHLAMELFKIETRTDAWHIPYRGAAPAINDLVAGRTQLAIVDLPVVLPYIKSGALTALAVTSDQRAKLLPEVPTMREEGYPRVNSDNWYGLFSPHQSLRANRDRIHDAAAVALQSPDLIDAFAAVGGVVAGGSSASFAAFLQSENDKWGEVIRQANIRFE